MELYRVFQKNPAAVAKFGSGGGMVLSTDKAFPIKYWRRQIQNWQSIINRDTKPLTVWSSYLENLEKNSIDFYASVKSLYLQDRQQRILNTKKIIDTQDDSDWEEISQ